MINISNVSVNIIDFDNQSYGFSHDFFEGVNILTGINSSGKSTILSCIYYCLGMEQLLSSNIKNALDKSLTSSFSLDNKNILVKESYCSLTINNGIETVTIKREIENKTKIINKNIVTLKIKNKTDQIKFIHYKKDHSSNKGFYSWLQEFSGIKIPLIDITGEHKPIIYLQHIFSAAMIEQTKGWTDFFAQMPYFNTIEPKKKLVQYLLNLNSLKNDYKEEFYKEEKTKIKKVWSEKINLLNDYASSNDIVINNIQESLNGQVSQFQINKSEALIPYNNDLIKVEDMIETLKNSIANSKIINNENKTKNLSAAQTIEIDNISAYIIQLKTIKEINSNEVLKISNYNENISRLKVEINRIQELNTIDSINLYSNEIDIHYCPVCDNDLTSNQPSRINDNEICYERSISYLKSQLNLYEYYIKNSKKLLNTYDKTCKYYEDLIIESRSKIESIDEDLDSMAKESRFSIEVEIRNKIKIEKLNEFLNYFNTLKLCLLEIIIKYDNISKKLDMITKNKIEDEKKIKSFLISFKYNLFNLEYSSNSKRDIIIKEEKPSKLLPFVKIHNNNTITELQQIRTSSSASDFVRALLAYYITLTSSKNHPGFSIFDEPGQHSMSLTTLQNLFALTKGTKHQFIFAISKDTSNKENSVNITSILENIDSSEYSLIEIQSKKCISKIS